MLAKFILEVFLPPILMLCVFHTPDLKSFSKKKKSNLNKLCDYWCFTIVFSNFFTAVGMSTSYNFAGNIGMVNYITFLPYIIQIFKKFFRYWDSFYLFCFAKPNDARIQKHK